jgi:tetratricopeptide (TPR) repeat protein
VNLSHTSAVAVRVGNLGRVAAWGLLVLAVFYAVIVGGGWIGIYSVTLRITSLVLIAIALTMWLAVAVIDSTWRPRTIFWPAFGACLVVFGLSVVTSRLPRLGIDYVAYAVLLHAFFRDRMGALVVSLLVVVGGWYVISCAQDWAQWWGLVGRITTPPLRPYFEGLTYGNPSAVMTIAVLLLTASIACLGLGTAPRRVLIGGLVALVAVVILLSGSRAGWLALAIAVAITAVVWLALPANRAVVRRLTRSRAVQAGVAVAAVVGVIGVMAFGPALLARAGAGGEALRGTFYLAALRMFESSPLVGTGPGTWVALRPEYTLATETDYYIPHAHSIYAQTAAEFGVLGIAAGVVVVACLAWLIRDALSDPDSVRRRFGWAALFGSAYFGAHQLLDFYANMPAALFAFAIPLAYLDATARRPVFGGRVGWPVSWRRPLSAIFAVGGVALIVASVVWLARSEAAAVQLAKGVDFVTAGDWAGALPSFRDAAAADPDMPPYQLELGIALANAGDLEGASAALERIAEADNLPAAWLNLASVRLRAGDRDGARDALERALALGAQQANINMGAGTIWTALGEPERATDAFAQALTQAPSLAGDPFWGTTPGVAELWPTILDRAISTSGGMGAVDMTLSSGDVERARAIASTLPDPSDRDLASLVIPAWEGDVKAREALYARAAARPLDASTLMWGSRVAARAGDPDRAKAFRSWIDGPNPGSGVSGYSVRVTDEPAQQVAGSDSLYYGHFGYRHPIASDQLVASLPHLEYRDEGR